MRRVMNRLGALGVSRLLGVERLVASAGRLERMEERTLLDGSGWGLVPSTVGGLGTFSAQFADMDGDSDLDLVELVPVGGQPAATGVRISRNDGAGNYGASVTTAFNAYSPYPLLLIDIDLDGDRDVVFRTENPFGGAETPSWRFLANGGDSTLGTSQAANIPLIASEGAWTTWDYDNDGREDLLLSTTADTTPSGLRLLRQVGDNQFQQVFSDANLFTSSFNPFVKGKIDAGDTTDVQLGSLSRTYLRWNGSAIEVASLGTFPDFASVQLFDFNRDGWLDQLVTPNGGPAASRLNDGAGNFGVESLLFDPTLDARAFTPVLDSIGDFTGDGRTDLLFRVNVPPANFNFLERWYEYRIYRASATGEYARNDFVVVGAYVDPYRTVGTAPRFTIARLNADSADDLLSVQFTQRVFLSTPDIIPTSVTAQVPAALVPANAQTLAITGVPVTAELGVTLEAFYDRNANGIVDDDDTRIGTRTTTTGNTSLTITPTDAMSLGATNVLVIARRDGQISSTLLLPTTAWTRSFFPEGFRGTRNINEYVPFTNDNPFPVEYRVVLRYESGERDQVIATGTIPAFTRAAPNNAWGVTTSERNNFSLPGRVGVPYAIELQSSAPLAAMLVRYDRNFAVNGQSPGLGESFATTTSTQWALADVGRGTTTLQSDSPPIIQQRTDYILLYNASPEQAFVRVDFYFGGQFVAFATRSLDPLRRAGVNLDDVPELAGINAPLSAVIASSRPIAASHTSYVRTTNFDPSRNTSSASMTLASPFSGGASTASVITPGLPERGIGLVRPDGSTNITGSMLLFNPSGSVRSVTLVSRVDDAFRAGTDALDARTETIVLQPFERRTYTVELRGIAGPSSSALPPVSIRATADGPVVASTYESRSRTPYRVSEANSSLASSVAATRWAFGDGFRHSGSFQNRSEETLYIANASGAAQVATIRFYSPSAGQFTTTVSLLPGGMRAVNLFALPELAAQPNLLWFGISVEATEPIVAGLSHFDGVQPGGWASLGTPLAGIVNL